MWSEATHENPFGVDLYQSPTRSELTPKQVGLSYLQRVEHAEFNSPEGRLKV